MRCFDIYDERDGISLPLGGPIYGVFISHNLEMQESLRIVDQQQPKPVSAQILIRRPIINTHIEFNLILSKMIIQFISFYLNKLTNDSKLISRFKLIKKYISFLSIKFTFTPCFSNLQKHLNHAQQRIKEAAQNLNTQDAHNF